MSARIDAAYTRVLHWVARGALRLRPPLGAKAAVDRVARWVPPLTADRAESAMRKIAPAGTCLSRALAIGARLPGAEVVIGLETRHSARPTGHAWIELDGVRIDPSGEAATPFRGEEIGRLPRTADRPGFDDARVAGRGDEV